MNYIFTPIVSLHERSYEMGESNLTPNDLKWIKNNDGTTTTIYKEIEITIIYDEIGQWAYYFDGDKEEIYGPLISKEEAMEAAMIEIDFEKGDRTDD